MQWSFIIFNFGENISEKCMNFMTSLLFYSINSQEWLDTSLGEGKTWTEKSMLFCRGGYYTPNEMTVQFRMVPFAPLFSSKQSSGLRPYSIETPVLVLSLNLSNVVSSQKSDWWLLWNRSCSNRGCAASVM